jgi:hypothetical protein
MELVTQGEFFITKSFISVQRLKQGSQTPIDLRATFQMKNHPRAAIKGKNDSEGHKTNKKPSN